MFEAAVILINYNSSGFTINCVHSIFGKTDPNLSFEVIIVDNCSEKADYELLKNFCEQTPYANVKLVRSKINSGFGAGNMFGVQYANAKYFAFVNNDTLFINDCLSILLRHMKNNPEIGICGPMAFKENGNFLPTMDHFVSLPKELFGRKPLEILNPKRYPNRKKIYDHPVRAQFIAGSFLVVKADDFNEVGGFDTNLFLYHEETDLCKRLARRKKFAFMIPEAKLTHFHGASTKKSIAIKIELKISLLYVIRKHHGYIPFVILLFCLQIRYFISSIFRPKYWDLFYVLIIGAPLSKSLKTKQKLQHI